MIYTYNPSQDEKLGWAKTEEIQELLTSKGVRTDRQDGGHATTSSIMWLPVVTDSAALCPK